MEPWLILAIIAAIATALYTFFDNYITDMYFKGNTPQAQKIFFGPAYLVTALIILLLFPINGTPIWIAVGLIVAGAISALSIIPYYSALSDDESTNVTIFEQLSPIFYLIFGRFMLGEEIVGGQLIGFLVVMMAPLLVILTSRKRNMKAKVKTAGLVMLKVILLAFANVLAVKFGYECDLVTMIFYVMLGKGLCDVTLGLFLKKWRKRFSFVCKQNQGVKFWSVLGIDHILYITSESCNYLALALAPAVAMASAVTKTLHPILVFVFGIILSILWPKFGREKNDKKTILIHSIAIIVAVIGIIIMQQ